MNNAIQELTYFYNAVPAGDNSTSANMRRALANDLYAILETIQAHRETLASVKVGK